MTFLKACRTFYVLFAILSLQLADNHMLACILLLIISAIGYNGYDKLIADHETILSNQLYEGTGND